ncbi:hypothetical protein niasHS_001264 [Heterodera schachtii]|uniref:Uncharacterized protein n=1 Tax=Heterodera schachtii TaxID=97005 RepID=A0ABD2KIU3_HETSC
MRKMLRSVFLLLVVVLIGWLITSAARNLITDFVQLVTPLIVNYFVIDPTAQTRIGTNILYVAIGLLTCVPILASASGAPILLLNSSEYRNAYKKLFMCKSTASSSAAVGPLFAN